MDPKNTEPTQIQGQPQKSRVVFGKILGMAGIVLVLVIIGGGALLASHTINPSWNPFKKAPDKGIRDRVIEIKNK